MAQQSAKQIESQEHVPANEHGGGFPPFQPETFASQLLWLALVFAALYLLMSRIALPRVGAILNERNLRIDGDLGEAQRLKGEADAASAAYEKALADARGRAQMLASERRAAEAARAEVARKELEAKLNTHIGEAEKAIAQTRATAMANVRDIATGTAAAIVERLIGHAPTEPQVTAAVADVLKR
jgi:F-type H+-transporting ATPase subunit b